MKEAFDKYISKFDLNDFGLVFKYKHTYRVIENIIRIAKSLNLNKEKTDLAIQIAYLHDIGRFEEGQKRGSFLEKDGYDHGDEGAILLFDDGLIKQFPVVEKNYEIVKNAIINHSKKDICQSLDEDSLFFSKLIRDADKFDIFYRISLLGIPFIEEKGDNLTPIILEEYKKMGTINKRILNTRTDRLILFLGLIFDVNYNETFKMIKEIKYLEKIKEFFPKDFKEVEVFEIAHQYIKERI